MLLAQRIGSQFASLTEEQLLHDLELSARPEVFLNLGGRTIILPYEGNENEKL